jgi:hypothetical protein
MITSRHMIFKFSRHMIFKFICALVVLVLLSISGCTSLPVNVSEPTFTNQADIFQNVPVWQSGLFDNPPAYTVNDIPNPDQGVKASKPPFTIDSQTTIAQIESLTQAEVMGLTDEDLKAITEIPKTGTPLINDFLASQISYLTVKELNNDNLQLNSFTPMVFYALKPYQVYILTPQKLNTLTLQNFEFLVENQANIFSASQLEYLARDTNKANSPLADKSTGADKLYRLRENQVMISTVSSPGLYELLKQADKNNITGMYAPDDTGLCAPDDYYNSVIKKSEEALYSQLNSMTSAQFKRLHTVAFDAAMVQFSRWDRANAFAIANSNPFPPEFFDSKGNIFPLARAYDESLECSYYDTRLKKLTNKSNVSPNSFLVKNNGALAVNTTIDDGHIDKVMDFLRYGNATFHSNFNFALYSDSKTDSVNEANDRIEFAREATSQPQLILDQQGQPTKVVPDIGGALYFQYFAAYYNGKYVDRDGNQPTKPSLGTTISDTTLSSALTVLMDTICDYIVIGGSYSGDNDAFRAPIIFDNQNGTIKWQNTSGNEPTLAKVLENLLGNNGSNISVTPSSIYTLAINGNPTGGYFTLTIDGKTTTRIGYKAPIVLFQSAIVVATGEQNATVIGTPGGPYTITLTSPPRASPTTDFTHLTGGPNVDVTIMPSSIYTLTIVGKPTGGTFTITVDGNTTSTLSPSAQSSDVQNAIIAATHEQNASVMGNPGGPYTIILGSAPKAAPTADSTHLTGGTNVNISVTPSSIYTLAIDGNPTGGTYSITADNQTTIPISPKAQAGDIQTAIVAATGEQNASVIGSTGGPYTIIMASMPNMNPTADASLLAGGNNADISVTPSSVYSLAIDGNPTGGTFTITIDGKTTSPLGPTAQAGDIQSAIMAKTDENNATVVGNQGGPYTIILGSTPKSAPTADFTLLAGGTNVDVTIKQIPYNIYTFTIVGKPTGGTFTITVDGKTTSTLSPKAQSDDVQNAIIAATGKQNVLVMGNQGGPYTIILGSTPIAPPTADASFLTGGDVNISVIPSSIYSLAIDGKPTGGTFSIAADNNTTIPIALNTQAIDIQSAIVTATGEQNASFIGNQSGTFTLILASTPNITPTADASLLTGGTYIKTISYVIEPIQTDDNLPGLTAEKLQVIQFLQGIASDGAQGLSGLILRTFGGVHIGVAFGVGALGKISIGDDNTLVAIFEAIVGEIVSRGTEVSASNLLYDVKYPSSGPQSSPQPGDSPVILLLKYLSNTNKSGG